LKSHVTGKEEMQRLLKAARRNLADAGVDVIRCETRFDSAYKAIMQLALAAMMANGFRPDSRALFDVIEPGYQPYVEMCSDPYVAT
jgi:hypothetical protein